MQRMNIFEPGSQEKDLTAKTAAGLERISQAFKVLLWEKAKELGLSPIQIQILIFVAHHHRQLANVSHLAQEFNVTKPTISDAIKALEKKNLILKDFSSSDSRSYTILLSEKGISTVDASQDFANPLYDQLGNLSKVERETFFAVLKKLIYGLNRRGILSVQRTCFGCRFYEKGQEGHYCNLLEKKLKDSQIRLDCPEFEPVG